MSARALKEEGPRMAAALSPVQAEAEGVKETTVTWRGKQWTVPTSPEDWPIEAVEAVEDGKATATVRELFGPKQWAAFKALKPTMRDLNELFEQIAKAAGFASAGE